MLNLTEYRKKPRSLSDYLPWATLIAPGVVLNKDGSFLRAFQYRGPDLDSSTQAELVQKVSLINNVLRRFSEGWVLYFEAERHPSIAYTPGRFPDIASWMVDREREHDFQESGTHFESSYYLSIMYLPPSDSLHQASDYIFEKGKGDKKAKGRYEEHLETFMLETEKTFELLSMVLPEIFPLNDVQILTYLHKTISNKSHPVHVPMIPFYLDSILADTSFIGGTEPILGSEYLRTITILGYPETTTPGLLDSLNDLGLPYRWVTRWIPLDKLEAENTLKKIRRLWYAKRKSVQALIREALFNQESALIDSDADNKASDADEALQTLGSDEVSFGYITTTITVSHENRDIVEDMILQVERAINSRGFVTIREKLNAVEAWFGSLPGNPYANVRKPIVHTLNLAHMMPVSAVWAGPKGNAHLKGPPHITAKTKGSTPFRFSLHVDDVGHSLVVGPTGAGKSVLLSLLALQFRKYVNAQIFFFDKGRSARTAMLSMGGKSFNLGIDKNLSFQPLAHIESQDELAIALSWILGLVSNENIDLTPEVKQEVWSALFNLSQAPRKERTITGLSMLLQSKVLRQALHPYTLEGAYGSLLDSDTDFIIDNDCLHFEMEELFHEKQIIFPVLSYLFQRLEKKLDGRPTLLVMDEAWVFLDHALFSERIRDWLKTLRKKNVAVVFATQSLTDISQSTIASSIIENCPTRIFLPNERALEPQIYSIYELFGLNDQQVNIISKSQPKCDYYLQTSRGNRLFELGLGKITRILCGSSTPEDHRLIDRIENTGTDSFLESFLRAKGLKDEAEFVARTNLKKSCRNS